jgi:hypothetical protein
MFLERGNDNLTYDPTVDGYTSGVFWTTVTGTPAISTTFLRFTSADAYTVSRYTKDIDIEFVFKVATNPTAGHARKWGLFLPAMGNRGACYFEVSGTTFRTRSYANNGTTLLLDAAVTWDSAAWLNTATRYRIRKSAGSVEFFINDVSVSQQVRVDPVVPVDVNIPLAIAISNGVADNLDLASLMLRGASNLA